MINRISSRQELVDYMLSKLGHPVIQINVDSHQIDLCVDEALQRYYEFHSDGSQRLYLKHEITPDEEQSRELTLPETIITVSRVVEANIGTSGSSITNLPQFMYMSDMIARTMQTSVGSPTHYTEAASFASSVGHFQQNMGYLATINQVFNALKTVRFIKYGHKLRIETDDLVLKAGTTLLLETYAINDADVYKETFDDLWLKRYATALLRKQWANNLMKYNGFQLPSGLTIDGSTILAEANNDLAALEEELRSTWEEPILPMIG